MDQGAPGRAPELADHRNAHLCRRPQHYARDAGLVSFAPEILRSISFIPFGTDYACFSSCVRGCADWCSSGDVCDSAVAVLLEFPVERGLADPQHPGCAELVAPRGFDSGQQRPPLDFGRGWVLEKRLRSPASASGLLSRGTRRLRVRR